MANRIPLSVDDEPAERPPCAPIGAGGRSFYNPDDVRAFLRSYSRPRMARVRADLQDMRERLAMLRSR